MRKRELRKQYISVIHDMIQRLNEELRIIHKVLWILESFEVGIQCEGIQKQKHQLVDEMELFLQEIEV